jgi:2-polyprenyl-3-methyl-5-hydroxy-6-metoxy-1,4-benzoquinol methylase
MDDREVAAASELFTTVLNAKLDAYHPWLYDYCGHLAHPGDTRRYLRHLHDLFEFARVDPRGATVVDAGCGFCFTLLTLGLLGAESLKGIDMSEPMIDTVRAYLPLLPPTMSGRM